MVLSWNVRRFQDICNLNQIDTKTCKEQLSDYFVRTWFQTNFAISTELGTTRGEHRPGGLQVFHRGVPLGLFVVEMFGHLRTEEGDGTNLPWFPRGVFCQKKIRLPRKSSCETLPNVWFVIGQLQFYIYIPCINVHKYQMEKLPRTMNSSAGRKKSKPLRRGVLVFSLQT